MAGICGYGHNNTVIVTNCWAFRMGTNIFGDTAWQGQRATASNFGGNNVVAHRTGGCAVFPFNPRNMANGFDQNNNIAGQTLDNDTSWSNFGVNFNLNHGVNTNAHVLLATIFRSPDTAATPFLYGFPLDQQQLVKGAVSGPGYRRCAECGLFSRYRIRRDDGVVSAGSSFYAAGAYRPLSSTKV